LWIVWFEAQPDPLAFYHAPAQKGSYLQALDQPVRKLKIGYALTSPGGGDLHPDCDAATLYAVDLCKSFGHEVVEMPLAIPFSGKQLGDIFSALWAVGAASPLAFYHKMTGNLYEQGQKISGADYEFARQGMHKVARSVLMAFQDIDIWLSPTLGMPPVDLGSFAQNESNPLAPSLMAAKFSPMTAIFNISGQPAASIPVYWNESGLPIGIQAVSKFGDEATIFQLAEQMEQVVKWQEKVPAILSSANS